MMVSHAPQPMPVSHRHHYTFSSLKSVMTSPEKLIPCLGHMLHKLTQSAPQPLIKESKFYCKTKPRISIQDYLKRIHCLAGCSQYIFLKALIYIDRFQNANQEFVLNQYSVHRQIICAVMIAAKYSQDFYYSNKHYSKVGGISQQDLNNLQKQFLEALDYGLYVQIDELNEYEQKLNSYYNYMIRNRQENAEQDCSPVKTEYNPAPPVTK